MNNINYIQTRNHASHFETTSPLLKVLRRLSDSLFLFSEPGSDESQQVRKVKEELRSIGLSRFQLNRSEAKHVAAYLNPDEHIKASIRGHVHGVGGVLLVATDSRILYLHDIPLFSTFEEFSYDVVSGISINQAGYLSSLAIFTKFKTYQIDYINPRQAERFINFVESQIYNPSLQNAINVAKEVLIR